MHQGFGEAKLKGEKKSKQNLDVARLRPAPLGPRGTAKASSCSNLKSQIQLFFV